MAGKIVNLTGMGKGRVKGVPNKTTTLAKTAISEAFDKLGGTDALVEWAQRNDDNRKVFYATIYPKLIPVQIGGDPNSPPIAHRQLPDAVVAGIEQAADEAY